MTKARTLADFNTTAIPASVLTGALPALNGSALTGISTRTDCSFFRRVSSDSVHQNLGTGLTAINYGTSLFDTGSDTSNTGVFTAPVTGKYQFTVKTTFGNLSTSHTLIEFWLERHTSGSLTNRVRGLNNIEKDFSANATDYHSLGYTTLMELTAGDTVTSNIHLTGQAGTLDIIAGNTNNLMTYFQGHLVEE